MSVIFLLIAFWLVRSGAENDHEGKRLFRSNGDLFCEDPVRITSADIACVTEKTNADGSYYSYTRNEYCTFGQNIQVKGHLELTQSLPSAELCVTISVCFLGSRYLCETHKIYQNVCSTLHVSSNRRLLCEDNGKREDGYSDSSSYDQDDYEASADDYYHSGDDYHHDDYYQSADDCHDDCYQSGDDYHHDDYYQSADDYHDHDDYFHSDDGYCNERHSAYGYGQCPAKGAYSFHTQFTLPQSDKHYVSSYLGSRWGFTVYVTAQNCLDTHSNFQVICQTSFKADNPGHVYGYAYAAKCASVGTAFVLLVGYVVWRRGLCQRAEEYDDDDDVSYTNSSSFVKMMDKHNGVLA